MGSLGGCVGDIVQNQANMVAESSVLFHLWESLERIMDANSLRPGQERK